MKAQLADMESTSMNASLAMQADIERLRADIQPMQAEYELRAVTVNRNPGRCCAAKRYVA